MLPGRGCSETKNVIIPLPYRLRNQNGCERAGLLGQHDHARGPERRCTAGSCTQIFPEKNRDPPHPDRPNTRPARCWSLHDGRGERRKEGHLLPRAGPCGRSEATESRYCMATAHGVGEAPVAVHVGPSATRSHELIQFSKHSFMQRQGRSRVWIRKTKVWGWRYGLPEKYGDGRRTVRADPILSVYARMASQERAGCLGRIAKLVSDPTSNCCRRQWHNAWTSGRSGPQKAPQRNPGST